MLNTGFQEYVLRVQDSSGKTSTVPVDRLPFSIGRGPENELVISDPSVSRRHAYIRRTPEGLTIVDNRSRNGIFVNQEKVSTAHALRPGDMVQIGAARLSVSLASVPDIPTSSRATETVHYFPSSDCDPIQTISGHFPTEKPSRRRRREDGARSGWKNVLELFLDAPLPAIYERILDVIEERVAFDRCFIILFEGGQPDHLEIIARRIHKEPRSEVIVSREILKRVAHSRESVVVTTKDENYVPTQSFIRSGATMATCVPLIVEGKVTGVIYLDRRAGEDGGQEILDAVSPLASLVALKIENVRLLDQHVAAQVIERDLKLAKEIMENLLPGGPIFTPGFAVEGYTEACYEVGGDYFDFFCPGEDRLSLVIGDVSGKGLPSALYVAGVRAALHAHTADGLEIDVVMSQLERHVCRTFRSDHFLTLFIGTLNPTTGRLSYCNAGHLPPICLRSNGEAVELDTTGPALNIVACQEFERHEFQMEPGDTLLLYTDGLIEAEDGEGHLFGTDRLVSSLVRFRDEELGLLRKSLLGEIEAFSSGSVSRDDKTLVLVRRE